MRLVWTLRRFLLTALPKVAVSRLTGMLTHLPVPRALRPRVYGWFARRYGAALDEMRGTLAEYPSLAEFFRRPLRPGARVVDAHASLVWPCDGRIVSAGPIQGDVVPQVKGIDYPISHLLVSGDLADRLRDGSQATIYLAPGDYHRVHAPCAGKLLRHWHVPGTLFPVNPPAVRSIPQLFPRNERMVYEVRTVEGRAVAVVMVAALNVGDIKVSRSAPGELEKGEELGAFGFGSTVVVLAEKGGPVFPSLPPETVVRLGGPAG